MPRANVDDGFALVKDDSLTFNSLRHFGITDRVRHGVKYQDIARITGTSVTHIEITYLYVVDNMKIGMMLD